MSEVDGAIDLQRLAVAWRQHVEKIARETDLLARAPEVVRDPQVWGAHDVAAALYIRDRIARLAVGRNHDAAAFDTVTGADTLFRSITREDEHDFLGRLIDEDLSDREWWWHRVPESGPIAEELEAHYGG